MSDLAPALCRCAWCDGTGRAVIYGVTVACACRPFDHRPPDDVPAPATSVAPAS